MKKWFTAVFYFAAITILTAQNAKPVIWTTAVEKLSEQEFYLIAEANIDPGWQLFSQNATENAAVPTAFTFDDSNGDFTIIGNTQELEATERTNAVTHATYFVFSGKAVFKQKIKLTAPSKKINAFVEYTIEDKNKNNSTQETDLLFDMTSATASHSSKELVKANMKTAPKDSKGLWSIFILAFLSGFAALLTPCVFPMIPMTVSFFTKQSKNKALGIRNAVLYGVSIIVIYVLLGTIVTAVFGAGALNALATNVWFNLMFFLLLVVFAISFLGAFEIVLPNSWANKVDTQADRGGLIGLFFMALALAIVSFSCTGPIVGTLLVQAASKGGIAPVLGMFGFSLAIALPFALFAAFPGWLNSLPKSGGWLNTVKVVLGFLELALAFKFLSQADLVAQMHLIEREVFLAIWIAVFGTLSLYLFGKITLLHDSPINHISIGRLSLGMVVLAFTLYMVPGLFGAPLNLISAFPPPQNYSESPYGVGGGQQALSTEAATELPDGAHLIAPHNILAFDDYDKGMAYAKSVGKPVMIDFTGWACVNCRKMEQNVWPKPEVLEMLKNKIVLISLYVDDKRPLDTNKIVESQLNPGKQLKYIGQKWSEMQTIKYKANSQPFYAIIDHQERNLIKPIAYTPDSDEYLLWLQSGIRNFKN
ncbi:protein-disulfide reductase DsbD family protein [Flavobacterium notoginsengisoli]|uniref:protein-disulfide reductase DsbD family protein n=1 Tax=Flavobacterium notoginsengisoli TaxID=1478199 RepID=UPI003625B7FE